MDSYADVNYGVFFNHRWILYRRKFTPMSLSSAIKNIAMSINYIV